MRNRASLTLALMLLTVGCGVDRTVEPTTTSGPRITTTATSQAPTTAATSKPVTTETSMTSTTVAEPGLMWARVPHDAAVFGDSSYDQGMHGLVIGGPGLVAVGSDESPGDYGYRDQDAAVWTSADGLAWARVPHDEAVFGGSCPQNTYGLNCSQAMYGVVAGGPGLVAVGYEADSPGMEANAAVWTSVDGLNWRRVPRDEAVFGGPDNQGMENVTAGGPGLVAVGEDESDRGAAVWTSTDGVAWTQVPYDEAVFGSSRMESVAAAGPGLVAVGSDSSGGDPDGAVWTSADGLSWIRVPPDEAVFGGPGWEEMYGVAAAGLGVIAVGHEGSGDDWNAVVWTSADGLTWTRARSDGGDFGGWYDQGMYGVAAGGPGVVAVGYADGQGIYAETNAAVWVGSPSG